MWYTKWLLVCPWFCSSSAGTLSSSSLPSVLQWLDPSVYIGFLPVVGLPVGLPAEHLPVFENFVVKWIFQVW
jgi:hypothetical protein